MSAASSLAPLVLGALGALVAGRAARADHIHVADGMLALGRPVAAATAAGDEGDEGDGGERWFVLDAERCEVVVFATDGAIVQRFGAPGSGPGELHEPGGIALADDGRVFVADTGNDRVQVFDAEGEPLGAFGGTGAMPGRFRAPGGLAVFENRLYVADTRNHRVQAFTLAGQLMFAFGERGRGQGQLDEPVDVAVDRRGDVYVADLRNHRIAKFDAQGRFLTSFGRPGARPGFLREPRGLAWSQGRLFVADAANGRIQAFDSQGRLRYLFGTPAQGPGAPWGAGTLHAPHGLAVAPDEKRALVCEPREARAQWFIEGDELDGAGVHADFGGAHQSSYAGPIAIGRQWLAVIDAGEASVSCYDVRHVEPRSIARLGGYGVALDRFIEPADVAIDAERGLVWVADAGQRRLAAFRVAAEPLESHVFDPKLAQFVKAVDVALLTDRLEPPLAAPFEPGVLAVAHGRVFVADRHTGEVLVLDDDGVLQVRWPKPLDAPADFAWDAARGVLWAVEGDSRPGTSGPRVVAYTPQGAASARLEPNDAEDWFPRAVCVDADGRVCVTSAARGHAPWADAAAGAEEGSEAASAGSAAIRVFEDGREVRAFGALGAGALELRLPAGIAAGPDGVLYVVDPWAHRGQAWLATGRFLLAF